MADRSHGDAIVDLEDFLAIAPHGEEHDPVAIGQRRDRAAARELMLDILAAIRDRLHPSVRFFDHPFRRLFPGKAWRAAFRGGW